MKRNLPASIQARLLNVSKARVEDFHRILTTFAVERFLYRLSILPAREEFWLKGARLFNLWYSVSGRATADVDFLGPGDSDIDTVKHVVTSICKVEAQDGLTFDPDTMKVEPIREESRYGGLRVRLSGLLGTMRCPIQLDIGFGDAVIPGPLDAEYPTLLPEMPAPWLRVYPRATVMAEKLEAIVHLGMANSRMKDYFDLLFLIREGHVDATQLEQSIRATFVRRGTLFPGRLPAGLDDAFATDPQKITQWNTFLRRNRLGNLPLDQVVEELRAGLAEALAAAGR